MNDILKAINEKMKSKNIVTDTRRTAETEQSNDSAIVKSSRVKIRNRQDDKIYTVGAVFESGGKIVLVMLDGQPRLMLPRDLILHNEEQPAENKQVVAPSEKNTDASAAVNTQRLQTTRAGFLSRFKTTQNK